MMFMSKLHNVFRLVACMIFSRVADWQTILLALCLSFAVTLRSTESRRQLIVTAFPGCAHADFYKNVWLNGTLQPIVDFLKEYAQKVEDCGYDDLMIVYPQNAPEIVPEEFPENALLLPVPCIDSQDIWMRDFTTVNPDDPVSWTYQPDYNPEDTNALINFQFKGLIRLAGLRQYTRNLEVDGGNIVDTSDKAIATWRIQEENPTWSEQGIKSELEYYLNKEMCFLPNPPNIFDTTGHSDGYVSFLNESLVFLADWGYPAEFAENWAAIRQCWPQVDIVRLPMQQDDSGGGGWSSAINATINLLVSDHCLYVPRFYEDESTEDEATQIIREYARDKTVVTINTGELSHMGGSVRCLSWQLYENTLLARALYRLQERRDPRKHSIPKEN